MQNYLGLPGVLYCQVIPYSALSNFLKIADFFFAACTIVVSSSCCAMVTHFWHPVFLWMYLSILGIQATWLFCDFSSLMNTRKVLGNLEMFCLIVSFLGFSKYLCITDYWFNSIVVKEHTMCTMSSFRCIY